MAFNRKLVISQKTEDVMMKEKNPSIGPNRAQQGVEHHQTWWKKYKLVALVVGIVIIVILLAIALVGVFGWTWTGFNGGYSKITTKNIIVNGKAADSEQAPAKTLWDWMQLFIIPVVLIIGGYLLNLALKRTEQEATADNQHEAALQGYIDKISELLLKAQLRESKPEDEVRRIARVRTLTVLPHLDSRRKKSVLQFLHESHLIDRSHHIISLSGADIGKADLKWIHLENARLNGALGGKADLRWVYLFGADFRGAHFGEADFSGADLREANLGEADLRGADLRGADLRGADLRGADLTGDKYNKKMIKEGTHYIKPTQWPQEFKLDIAGTICVDC